MKPTATSTPTSDPHVTLELLDQPATKPSSKNRSRAEQRHHRDRVKQNRVEKLKENDPDTPLEDYNQRWLAGLDSHHLGCSCRGCRAHSKDHKFSTKDRREFVFDEENYPEEVQYDGQDY